MSVIIEELNAEVENGEREGGGADAARPTEGPSQQALIDLLELSQERKDRLAVD